MIHYLKVKNFYSIRDEQAVSFISDRSEPYNNSYLESAQEKISKVNMFVGSNASGKTNFLKSFAFIKWLICKSFDIEPDALLPFKNFFENNENTIFEVAFAIKETLYTYKVELTRKKIISEELLSKSLVNERRTTKIIFSRNLDYNKGKYIYKDSNLSFTSYKPEVLDRTNVSLLAIGRQFNDSKSIEIFNYWNNLNTNIQETGYGGNNPLEIMESLASFHIFPDEKVNVEKMLRRFDLGFDSIKFKTEEQDNSVTIQDVVENHNFGDKIYSNDINYSSNGTKRLLLVMRYILASIKSKSPLIMDELEAFLHPDILREIIDMFIDSEVESQLIFSSHSLAIMKKLDKNQIFFAEKNIINGSTEVFKLNDIEGVRTDDNFYNKYIAGAYGAKPRI